MAQTSLNRAKEACKGFTLLEVLVSTAILAVILVLFASMFSSTHEGVRLLNNSTKQRQEARVVLAKIAGELKESLTSPSVSYESNDPAARQFQLLINPPAMGELANAHTLFWSSASGNHADSGLIGYAVRWDKTDPAAPKPRLCRMFISQNESQHLLADLKTSVPSGAWANEILMGTFAPADEANGYRGWLADNILALYARALDPQNQPITRTARTITGVTNPSAVYYQGMSWITFDSSLQGTSYTIPDPTAGGTDRGYDSRMGYQFQQPTQTAPGGFTLVNRFGPALPASVEIVLLALSPEAISRMTSIPTPVRGSTATTMWTDIDTFISNLPQNLRADVRIYSTIVSLSP
jgi:prepilin-type N-terminal cleavage/methylation domain-containing protein